MKFDHVFIAIGIAAGLALPFAGAAFPALKALPALLWLLLAILAFDIAAAQIRGVPVMASVPTLTRAIAFIGGGVALILSGGLW